MENGYLRVLTPCTAVVDHLSGLCSVCQISGPSESRDLARLVPENQAGNRLRTRTAPSIRFARLEAFRESSNTPELTIVRSRGGTLQKGGG